MSSVFFCLKIVDSSSSSSLFSLNTQIWLDIENSVVFFQFILDYKMFSL